MSNASGFQSLQCKKCGRGDFYHPKEGEDIGTWHRVDKFGNVQAFEHGFDAPHWYICPANPVGMDHRKKMEGEMTEFVKREYQKREDAATLKVTPHPPEQVRLPSEYLTPLDREISAKLNVMELILDDIKRLMAQKAQSDI